MSDQEKAIGGHARCHTCAAHCVVIEDLQAENTALRAERDRVQASHDYWDKKLDALRTILREYADTYSAKRVKETEPLHRLERPIQAAQREARARALLAEGRA
jgi:hypothetical protein